MTYETKTLLKACAILIVPAAILICTALFVWSCDGSQFECGRLGAIQPNMSAICNGYVACQPACSVTPALNPFPVRVVSSVATFSRTSLATRTESGDCCTFRLAVGMHNPAAEFHTAHTDEQATEQNEECSITKTEDSYEVTKQGWQTARHTTSGSRRYRSITDPCQPYTFNP